MKKYNNYDLHFRFETKEGVDFLNAEYIHPLKQQLVQSYVTCFWQDPNVKAGIQELPGGIYGRNGYRLFGYGWEPVKRRDREKGNCCI